MRQIRYRSIEGVDEEPGKAPQSDQKARQPPRFNSDSLLFKAIRRASGIIEGGNGL